MKSEGKRTVRRKPVQIRARVTVDAVLDAAVKLLKHGGAAALTTNRIAETAGVSIGSVYQYFPNKRAIYIALHERHIAQVDAVMRRRITQSVEVPLRDLIEAMIDGMIELHNVDPELSDLLQAEVADRADGGKGFSVRNHSLFRNALTPYVREFGRKTDLNMRAFIVSTMIDSLGHAIALRRPSRTSLSRARSEVRLAIEVYLKS